ncbi:glycoside hydrolase family 5 protein [Flindersiella endophytica]
MNHELSRRQLLAATGALTAGLVVSPAWKGRAYADGFYAGANLSGLEVGGTVPGIPNTNYAVPTHADLDYLRSRGLTTIRLPFKWERIQPQLNGELDAMYLGFVTDLVDHAASIGQELILDPHNFGGYGSNKLGDGALTGAHFANLWTRLATVFAGRPGVAAYDLMNEPANLPSPPAWPEAAQAAIDAVRAVDTATLILAEGDHWSSAASWVQVNGSLDLHDPAGNLVYSAHTYFDRDSSGTHFSWSEEVAAGDQLKSPPGPLTTQIGVERLTGFVNWLTEHGFRGQVGEAGTGNDDPHWLETLDNTLAFCQDNGIGLTYWSAGPWFDQYPMGIQPLRDGRDTVQMAVLEKYTGGAAPTDYYLSGPDRGSAGTASAPFTVDYRGYHTQPLTIRPDDGGAGGSFVPTSLTLASGFNGLATFAYTAPATATYTIGCTNSSGLTDPGTVGFSTRADAYSAVPASGILNVLATRRLYTPFIGDAVTLRRAGDGAQRAFAFRADDTLDSAAISAWAGGAEVSVVTLADQSPAGRHAGPVVTQNHNASDGGQLASSPADYPKLVLDGLNGMPVLRLARSRMDAVSPLNGLTGFTCFLVCKPNSLAHMQRLLSWHFVQYNVLGNQSGAWEMTGEPNLAMGIDISAWHIYAVRWSGGGQRTTWVDGEQVAMAAAATSTFTFDYENHVNIGYFRWYNDDVYFDGDVWAMLPFSVALTDAQMTAMWSALSAATGIAV